MQRMARHLRVRARSSLQLTITTELATTMKNGERYIVGTQYDSSLIFVSPASPHPHTCSSEGSCCSRLLGLIHQVGGAGHCYADD